MGLVGLNQARQPPQTRLSKAEKGSFGVVMSTSLSCYEGSEKSRSRYNAEYKRSGWVIQIGMDLLHKTSKPLPKSTENDLCKTPPIITFSVKSFLSCIVHSSIQQPPVL
jgi:hypothetical protein